MPNPPLKSDVSDPTWEELLTTNTETFEFPPAPNFMNLEEPQTNANHHSVINGRETQHVATELTVHPSMSSGLSSSYSALPRYPAPPPPNPIFGSHKNKPSVVSYPLATTPSISQLPPVSVIRPEVKMATRPSDISTGTQVGRWTKREHELFLEGLQRFGKSWKKISSLVHTRTLVQIRTHAQKYLQKQSRAALKADAKAAAAADKNREKMPPKPQEIKQEQPQGQTTTKPCQLQEKQQVKPLFCPPQLHTNISVASMPGGQTEVPRTSSLVWKASRTGDRNSGFVPLSFPSVLSASASRVLSEAGPSSHTMSSSTIPPRSAFQLNSINKLDQLLQEDNNGNIPACVDEYYSSPTAIEDDLLRSLYSGEPQWMSRFALAGGPIGNRRRLDVNAPACASSSPSTLPVVPALRPPFSNGVFEPLPAPANLSSPSGSPTTYIQQQSEGTDKATNYPTAWI